MTVLVTGSAGFVGFNLCERLLKEGHDVIGIDNLNDYYDVSLKQARTAALQENRHFTFRQMDISDITKADMMDVDIIFHLAAYAGVRDSVEKPLLYHDVNVNFTLKLLELSIAHAEKFLFASTSAVYGTTSEFPTSEEAQLNPVSPYGASKLAAEKYCETYANCYGIPVINFRYYTMYGQWGRPDMLILRDIMSCLDGTDTVVYMRDGAVVDTVRDFLHIDDAVDANIIAMNSNIKKGCFNVGSGKSVPISFVRNLIASITCKKQHFVEEEASPGDPPKTCADIAKVRKALQWEPAVGLEDGIRKTVAWYKQYKGYK
ncbi:MAG: GDP-mannose 4,6-dehydratase [Candidatus Aenigmarchaeota archaeon]|nr:GDP-mannose 4,6-dehydratase [Candidatus Aenigmarchaeota archaeon]